MELADRQILAVYPDPGGGYGVRFARGGDVSAFIDDIVEAVASGDFGRHSYWFALGFAAAVDAISAGSVSFGDAVGTVRAAWWDMVEKDPHGRCVSEAMREFDIASLVKAV